MAGSSAADVDDVIETHKEIVKLFSKTDDQRAVREAGQSIAELHESTRVKHLEMQQSIKGAAVRPPCARPSRSDRSSSVVRAHQS